MPSKVCDKIEVNPDSKVHEDNKAPTLVLSAPGGSHVGLENLAIWEFTSIKGAPLSNRSQVMEKFNYTSISKAI